MTPSKESMEKRNEEIARECLSHDEESILIRNGLSWKGIVRLITEALDSKDSEIAKLREHCVRLGKALKKIDRVVGGCACDMDKLSADRFERDLNMAIEAFQEALSLLPDEIKKEIEK